MTGAQAIVSTLADNGVTACFANPGTSEMHLVTALDNEPRIRSVLCLFEGVATGAADGFARASGIPAMTLLHLGPGYLNAGANIHNAKRARSPMINVIGDHAVHHRGYDAPLTSDIKGLAGPNSNWLKSADTPQETGALASEAFMASLSDDPGPVSLLLPADAAWTEGAEKGPVVSPPSRPKVPDAEIAKTAKALESADAPVLLINGSGVGEAGLQAAARLEGAGIKVFSDTFLHRQRRGAGLFAPQRLQYFAEGAIEELQAFDLLVTAGTLSPVAFFAYPNTPSDLVPDGVKTLSLGGRETDSADTLARLAQALGTNAAAGAPEYVMPDMPTGDLSGFTIGQSLTRHMPENALVSEDGSINGTMSYMTTGAARPHDWMMLTGGSIGQGLPLALGAAIAAPDRKVIALTGDGAGMYTPQALWSMAREQVDVTCVVFINNSYGILNIELARTGAGNPGPTAKNMLSMGDPAIDWVQLSQSMGVPAVSVETTEAFDKALEETLAIKGPRLIAAHVTS
ncbi:MAG: acetolactate synthase large subunit [Pseudomonadota bacterium]